MTSGSPDAIGPYAVVRELGRGGMGVVHLARDTRLDRDVAIKALPAELASDPSRLERFEREARTLAQLNHPGLAGIHGVEEQDGARYLVLEYVEGETLADMLERGPLPADEAIDLAVQIAAGIEAAHEVGVIHRDLKPANIIVTPNGQARVLDFGLARTEEAVASTGGLDRPTMTSPAMQHSPTIAGAILGTAAYMSPEQARGRRVDKRTDIWSFGVVLYEMLVGTSPFHGETATDSIGAVLHKGIDLDRLPPGTPPRVRHALRRCLARDRAKRARDIGDVRLELMDEEAHEPIAPDRDRAPGRRRGPSVVLVVTTTIAALSLAWLLLPRAEVGRDRHVTHLAIDFPADQILASRLFPKISADGRRLVFRGYDDRTGYHILVRDLGSPEARMIETPPDARDFALSPDGEWVLYDARRTLHRTQLGGGPAIPICESPETRGTAWGEDGVIVFAPESRGPLHRVDANGGRPAPMYELDATEPISDRHPAVLPGNRGVLFVRSMGDVSAWGQTSLWVVDLQGGQPRQLARNAAHGRYVAPGLLVFQREDTLMAAGFDLDRLEITTPEIPAVRGLGATTADTPSPFDVSPNGTLVYLTGGSASIDRRIERIALDGTTTPVSNRVDSYGKVVPSDDGRLLGIEIEGGLEPTRLAILEPGRDLLTPLRNDGAGSDMFPVWSPDGRWIAFGSNRHGGIFNVYRHRVGSASEPERLQESDLITLPEDWSGDGRRLLVSIGAGVGEVDIAEIHFDERGETTGEVVPFIDWPGNQFRARLSPDDRWVMFISGTAGARHELFVVDADDPSRSIQVSTNGALDGVWDPARDRVYYLGMAGDAQVLHAVDYRVHEDGTFVPSAPEPRFPVADAAAIRSLHMIEDGDAFIRAGPLETAASEADRDVRIVLNWDEELRPLLAGD